MMFKMIREAQAVAALGDKLSLAKQVQQLVGLESLADASKLIVEQFDPSQFEIKPEYYNEWMSALQGEAEAQGVDITKKQDFMDFAHMMLENDPRIQELGADEMLVQKIVTTLWTAARAAQSHAKVSRHVDKHIQKTREEEEAVDELVGSQDEEQPMETRDRRALPRLDTRTNPTDKYPSRPFNRDEWMNTSKQARPTPQEDEEKKKTPYDEWMNRSRARNGRSAFFDGSRSRPQENEECEFSQVMKNSMGMEDESHVEFEHDIHKNAKTNPYPKNTLRHALWADMHKSNEDEEFDDAEGMPSQEMSPDEHAVSIMDNPEHDQEDGRTPPEDLEHRVDDLEDRIADLEHDEHDTESSSNDELMNQEHKNNPEMDMLKSDTHDEPEFDEEEAVKSFFRKAVTAPKQMLSKAVKDIESEGASAWMKLNMPANPHPKKSQAHAAWAKGMKNAAKEALGLHEKPTMVTSKFKPRRK